MKKANYLRYAHFLQTSSTMKQISTSNTMYRMIIKRRTISYESLSIVINFEVLILIFVFYFW